MSRKHPAPQKLCIYKEIHCTCEFYKALIQSGHFEATPATECAFSWKAVCLRHKRPARGRQQIFALQTQVVLMQIPD